jgi:hypothetical protein
VRLGIENEQSALDDRRTSRRCDRTLDALTAVVLLAVVLGQAASLSTGRADNGDFTRACLPYADRPVGFATSWPAIGTADWDRRFFRFWLPVWVRSSDPEAAYAKPTSGHLLWAPGATLADLLDGSVVDLRILSVPARAVVVTSYLLLIALARRARSLVCLTGVLAFVAVTSDLAYASFLNSFYEDGASLAFACVVVLALGCFVAGHMTAFGIAFPVAATLLTTARAGNAAIGLVSAAFYVVAWRAYGGRRRSGWTAAGGAAVLVAASAVSVLHVGRYPSTLPVNQYHALFKGALTFSARPQEHLDALGFPDESRQLIGQHAFGDRASAFATDHGAQLTFGSVARTVIREPSIALRAAWYTLGRLEDVRLADLGMLPPDGELPRGASAFLLVSRAKLRLHDAPALVAMLLLSLAAALIVLARRESSRRIAAAGAYLYLAFLGSAAVAIVGDGRHEIEKHLFVANLLLDLSLIAAAIGVAMDTSRARTPRGRGAAPP